MLFHKYLFLLVFVYELYPVEFRDYTCFCVLGSLLEGSGDTLGCYGLNLGQTHARQDPYPFTVLSLQPLIKYFFETILIKDNRQRIFFTSYMTPNIVSEFSSKSCSINIYELFNKAAALKRFYTVYKYFSNTDYQGNTN